MNNNCVKIPSVKLYQPTRAEGFAMNRSAVHGKIANPKMAACSHCTINHPIIAHILK